MDKGVQPRGLLTASVFQVQADLEKQKKLLRTVNLSVLPDKGEKIKNKVEELQKLFDTLTLESKFEPLSLDSDKNNEIETTSDCCISTIKGDQGVEEKFGFSKALANHSSKQVSAVFCKDTIEKNNEIDSSRASSISTKKGDNCAKEKYKFPESGPSQLQLNSALIKPSKGGITAFSKDYDSDFSDFEKLSKSLPLTDEQLDDIYQSPSFKGFRSTKAIPSLKLTEAKPLFEVPTSRKGCKPVYSVTRPNAVLSEDVVQKLHHTLAVYPEDAEEETEPRLLDTSLMPHQVHALSWMVWREAQQPSGGILADDMGLGKTLTLISLILKQRETKSFLADKTGDNTRCTLVICLATILHQWIQEIEKHCKHNSLQVLLFHGPKRNRSADALRKEDVVVTTYSTLLSERKALEKNKESGLFSLKWERIILDEAHTIKNHASQTAGAIFALKGYRRWCVTGTPIHNNLQDMFSLIKFLQLYPFNDHKKWKKLTSDDTAASRERMNLLVKSLLLRRTKEDKDATQKPLVNMAKKKVSILFFELSAEEQILYDQLNDQLKEALMKYVRKSTKKLNTSSNLLVMLLRLQQCCSHVGLLRKAASEEVADNSTDDILEPFSAMNIQDVSTDSDSGLDITFSSYQESNLSDHFYKSTKLKNLFDKLDDIAEESGNKAKSVIVSQWVSMLEIVGEHLEKAGTRYHKIFGSTKVEDRQAASNDFNNNEKGAKILLLSLKAGGVGLNLVGASHLFLLDLHWNPALEKQACDRIHRVGQKKDVFIHKFVCKNTIEEKILELQEKKSLEASHVLQGGRKVTKGLSMEDFKTLFNIPL